MFYLISMFNFSSTNKMCTSSPSLAHTPCSVPAQVGVVDKEATETLVVQERSISARVKLLKNIMTQLDHTWVDVLKLDVHGYEYRALWPMIAEGNLPFT